MRFFVRVSEVGFSLIIYWDSFSLKIRLRSTRVCFDNSTEKLAEATRKFSGLQSDLSITQHAQQSESTGLRRRLPSLLQKNKDKSLNAVPGEHVVRKSMHDIKLAFSEFYLSLVLLQNYQSLNFTGFRKILKKHDKVRF